MADQEIPTGIDVSSRQGAVDWQAAKAAGLDFAFIKAKEGTGYTNPYFKSNWAAAKAAGILRGAYLFYRWDANPLQQAQMLVDFVRTSGDMGEFPLTIDVENTGDGAGPHPYTQAEMVRRLRDCADTIKALTGRSPIIYTYPSMWRDVLGNPQNFADCPLWLASYTPKQPRPIGGWKTLTFWQTSASGHVAGVVGLVDTDVFVGSMAELRAFAGISDDKPLFFPQTGYYLSHGFKDLWQEYGDKALATCGYPLSPEYGGEGGYTYQDFENVIFEYKAGEEPRIGAAVRKLKYGY